MLAGLEHKTLDVDALVDIAIHWMALRYHYGTTSIL
jgi:hypothetical protein